MADTNKLVFYLHIKVHIGLPTPKHCWVTVEKTCRKFWNDGGKKISGTGQRWERDSSFFKAEEIVDTKTPQQKLYENDFGTKMVHQHSKVL